MDTTLRAARPSPYPVARHALRVGLLLGAGLAITAAWAFLAWQVAGALADTPVDFLAFHRSAARFLAGLPPYADPPIIRGYPIPNLNHPALLLAFVPLALLPLRVAFLLWIAASLACYAVALRLVWREVGADLAPGVGRWALLAFATNAGVLLSMGQVTPPLTVALVAAWLLLRRSRTVPAGVILGALAILKPFLLPLLAYFLLRRDWRALAGAALGALGLSLAALPAVGLAGYRAWVATLGGIAWYGHANNVSLVGVLYRVTSQPPPALVAAISVGLPLAGLAALALRRSPAAVRGDRDFAALLALGVLASPLGWSYYLPFLLPALAGLGTHWRDRSPLGRAAVAVAVAAAVASYPFNPAPLVSAGGTVALGALVVAAWALRPQPITTTCTRSATAGAAPRSQTTSIAP